MKTGTPDESCSHTVDRVDQSQKRKDGLDWNGACVDVDSVTDKPGAMIHHDRRIGRVRRNTPMLPRTMSSRPPEAN